MEPYTRTMNTSTPIIGLDEYASDEALAAVELFVGHSKQWMKFTIVCFIIFIIIGVPSNLITIAALAGFKKIQNATALFVINLSVADLLFCALVLPIKVSTLWKQSWPFGRLLCRLFPLCYYSLVIISLYTTVAIAINRYVLICHPTRYCTIFKRRNIYIMILITWIFAFGLTLLPFFEVWGRMSLDLDCACTIVQDKYNRNPKKVFLFLTLFTSYTVIIGCYICILSKVKGSVKICNPRGPGIIQFDSATNYYTDTFAEQRYSASSSSADNNSQGHHMSNLNVEAEVSNVQKQSKAEKMLPSKKDKKLRTMVYAILLCLFICYVPVTLTQIVYNHIDTSPTFYIIALILISAAPCINPILYAFMSKDYRQAYRHLFRLQK